jgi:hypothetical protein
MGNEKRALSDLNRRMQEAIFGARPGKRTPRRLSYAEAWLEAQRCRQRMRRFGHY